jgi:hypothetical protein
MEQTEQKSKNNPTWINALMSIMLNSEESKEGSPPPNAPLEHETTNTAG